MESFLLAVFVGCTTIFAHQNALCPVPLEDFISQPNMVAAAISTRPHPLTRSSPPALKPQFSVRTSYAQSRQLEVHPDYVHGTYRDKNGQLWQHPCLAYRDSGHINGIAFVRVTDLSEPLTSTTSEIAIRWRSVLYYINKDRRIAKCLHQEGVSNYSRLDKNKLKVRDAITKFDEDGFQIGTYTTIHQLQKVKEFAQRDLIDDRFVILDLVNDDPSLPNPVKH
jgi:hypothetical protein